MPNLDKLRALPKVDVLLQDSALQNATQLYGYAPVLSAARQVVERLRCEILEGCTEPCCTTDVVVAAVLSELSAAALPSLRPVINGTGIVLHTNLGRAVLAKAAAQAAYDAALNYSTLEYDVESGSRGSRHSHVESLICKLCNCGAAMVVNNNAAAVMLALNALAKGGEVIVSRGELVEIGGSFRVPQIMEQSGCRLCEVGTTNKTHPSDYEGAIGEWTSALLKVHTSNYKIMGFTEDVSAAEMAEIATAAGLPLIYDLGSGALFDTAKYGLIGEPSVMEAMASSADIITFSGDKLLGGPQAGIIVGKKEYIALMKKNPLARAFRVDKMTLAALEATLRIYLDPLQAEQAIPTLAMLNQPMDALWERAKRLMKMLAPLPLKCEICDETGQVGGGSVPTQMLPTFALSVQCESISENALEQQLRVRDLPIIVRISKNKLIFDMRTIFDSQLSEIRNAFTEILA